MNTDWKALCAELLQELEHASEWDYQQALKDQARTALAQPEPQGPTDNDLLGCMIEAANSVPGGQSTGIIDWEREAIAAARAVLARWGCPTITPIPVGEGLPGDQLCWWFEADEDGGYGSNWTLLRIRGSATGYTHWLPASALPLPTTEANP